MDDRWPQPAYFVTAQSSVASLLLLCCLLVLDTKESVIATHVGYIPRPFDLGLESGPLHRRTPGNENVTSVYQRERERERERE